MKDFFMHEGGKTMYIVFLVVLLIPFIVMIVMNALEKKTEDVVVTEKTQCKNYVLGITLLWGVTLLIFIMCYIGKISLEDIGFRPIKFNYNIWFTIITLVVSGIALIYFIYQLIASLGSSRFIEKQMADSNQGTIGVLPRTKKEKCLFSLLALSAGICEEVIFRGFLIFLVLAIFPNAPIYLVILISTLIFGIAHAYQGLQGVISTGLLAIMFMCLFLVTDCLIFAILLHFIIDFSATFILSEKNMVDSKTENPDSNKEIRREIWK